MRIIRSTVNMIIILSAYILAAHLAMHYLELARKPEDSLKSLVLLGSMGRFRVMPVG